MSHMSPISVLLLIIISILLFVAIVIHRQVLTNVQIMKSYSLDKSNTYDIDIDKKDISSVYPLDDDLVYDNFQISGIPVLRASRVGKAKEVGIVKNLKIFANHVQVTIGLYDDVESRDILKLLQSNQLTVVPEALRERSAVAICKISNITLF